MEGVSDSPGIEDAFQAGIAEASTANGSREAQEYDDQNIKVGCSIHMLSRRIVSNHAKAPLQLRR